MFQARRAVLQAVRTVVESLEDRRLLASASIGTPSFGGNGAYVPVTLTGSSAPSLTTNHFVLQNLAAPDTSETHAVDVATAGVVSTFKLNHATDSSHPVPLQDGWYDACVRHTGLTPDETHASFRFLNGDFDGDGGVSIMDYFIVSDNNNFGHTGRTFAQGDADYDGGVSINDFNIMAGNFGKSLPNPPSADDGVSVGVTQDFALDVSWYTNPDEPRDGFKIYRSDDNGLTYSVVQTIRQTDADFWRDTGLVVGHKYWYRVRSFTDAYGAGPSVTRDWGIPISSAPLPSDLWATGIGNNSIWVEWEAATNEPVQNYCLYRSETPSNNLADYTLVDGNIDPSLTQYTDTRRVIGTTYYYTLTAVGTDNYVSPPLPPVSATVENQAPVITGGDDQITTGTTATVSVTATDDGGAENLSYAWSAVSTPGGAGDPAIHSQDESSTLVEFYQAGYYELSVTVTDLLSASSSYTVGVDVIQKADSVAITPTQLTMRPGDSETFTATADDQFGDDIADPVVRWTSDWNGVFLDVEYVAPAADEDVVHAEVDGKTADADVEITLPTPVNLAVTMGNEREANVTWAPSAPGSAYVIEWRKNDQQNYAAHPVPVNATGWSIGGLDVDTDYQFRIKAVYKGFASEPSDDVAVHTGGGREPTNSGSISGSIDGDRDGTITVSDLTPGARYHLVFTFSPSGRWDGEGTPRTDSAVVGRDWFSVEMDGGYLYDNKTVNTSDFNSDPRQTADYYGFVPPYEKDFTATEDPIIIDVTSGMVDLEDLPFRDEGWTASVSVTPIFSGGPTITVNPTDPSGWEVPLGTEKEKDEKIVFEVRRTPLPYEFSDEEQYDETKFYPGAMAVDFFPPAGLALSGDDYTGYTPSVTIPDGQPFAELTMTTVADSKHDPDEDIALRVKATSRYKSPYAYGSGGITNLGVDLSIDSNNDGTIDTTPGGSDDRIEFDPTKPGKYVDIDNYDKDGDHVPGYADGYSLSGGPDHQTDVGNFFTPIKVTIPDGADLNVGSIIFTYDDTYPNQVTFPAGAGLLEPWDYKLPQNEYGRLRLWSIDGNVQRSAVPFVSVDNQALGNFIEDGSDITLHNLGFTNSTRTITLYVEAVGTSPAGYTTQQPITVTYLAKPNGPEVSDTVNVTAVYNPNGWRAMQRETAKFSSRNWKVSYGLTNDNKDGLRAIYNYYGKVYKRSKDPQATVVGRGDMEWAGLAKVAGQSVIYTDEKLSNVLSMLTDIRAFALKPAARPLIVRQGGVASVLTSLIGPFSNPLALVNPDTMAQLLATNVNAMQANSTAVLLQFLDTSFGIFNDVGWQLEAYQIAGLKEMERIGDLDLPEFPGHQAKARDPSRVDLVDAWSYMDGPRTNRFGNEMLIDQEQRIVAQPFFDAIAGPPGNPKWMISPGTPGFPNGLSVGEALSIGSVVKEPFEGAQTFFEWRAVQRPGGVITNFNDRYQYFANYLWPLWLSHPYDSKRDTIIDQPLP